VNVPRKAIFLLGERRQFVFEGEIYLALHPFLNGHFTYPEIVGKLGSIFSVMDITRALSKMTQQGCLTDATDCEVADSEDTDALLWDDLRLDPCRSARQVSGSRIQFAAVGSVNAAELETSFRQNGVDLHDEGSFLMVATSDYLCDDLAIINRQALVSGTPWLLFKPLGTVLLIGPVFVPGTTACWECLAHRLRTNRHVDQFLSKHAQRVVVPERSQASLSSSRKFAVDLAILEAKRTLASDRKTLENQILTINLTDLEQKFHHVSHRPQCHACGVSKFLDSRTAKPLDLRSALKRSNEHRTASVFETYARVEPHVSPLTGVVTSLLTKESELAGPWFNCVAGHYFPTFSDDLMSLCLNLSARSGGKGATEVEAKTGAICESIERYSGIYWGDEPSFDARIAELGDDAIAIDKLLQFSDEQYACRSTLPISQQSDRHDAPPRWDSDRSISWTPVWSLSEKRTRFVPTAYCYYGFRDHGQFISRCDSNGSASGNTIEEAIVQGFFELAERDAVALWWYNRILRPGVNLESFNLPYWGEVKNCYEQRLGRDLHCLDLTNDLGVPTFAVISRRLNSANEDIILGFGAHFDPCIAVMRALKEANQYLPSFRTGADGRTHYQSEPEIIEWWQNATYESQPYLLPDQDSNVNDLGSYPTYAEFDVLADVNRAIDACARLGLEFLVLDQTRPDIGFPVAKVIVPGLRHFWRRLAPGRLYEVPVKLGWLNRPNMESDMNPISCFV
jgi:ribosomal protein S12 methylthiotransferase accessory factor